MKRGFLKNATTVNTASGQPSTQLIAQSAVQDLPPNGGHLTTVAHALGGSSTHDHRPSSSQPYPATQSTSDIRYQLSDTCRVHSENPRIIRADWRQPFAHFLFLPPKNADVVFVDSLPNIESIAAWPIWDLPAPSPPAGPPFVIRDADEKGLGMFARSAIAMGDLIMCERPVYVTPATVPVSPDQKTAFYSATLSGLAPAVQGTIAGLHNAQPVTRDVCHLRGVLLTNALTAKIPHTATAYPALFPRLSRANHDCAPNAHYFFCRESFTGRFHALRRIGAGEEITVAYTDLAAPRAQRQADLLAKYRFVCSCAACGLPAERTAESDARRRAMAVHLASTEKRAFLETVSLARVAELIRWAEEERLVEVASLLATSGLRLGPGKDGAGFEVLKMTLRAMNYCRALEGNDSVTFAGMAARIGMTAQELVSAFEHPKAIENIGYSVLERLLAERNNS